MQPTHGSTNHVFKFNTLAVHAGNAPDPVTGAVILPLSLSTTFAQSSAGVPLGPYDYSRSGNPTRHAFEAAVSALEGGEFGLAFSSGSATTATVASLLSSGEHLVSVNDVYGGTFRFFTKVLKSHGVNCDFVDLINPENLRAAIKPNTKMVWIETPTNPTLKLVDIKRIAEICKEFPGVILVVDNTFMSSYFQKPLSLGADIVVHSVTKYMNGHSDVVMGIAVTSNPDLKARLAFLQNSIGGVPSPFDCFLANRGLKTLHIRMERHASNAMAVARFLEAHPLVQEAIYPGLESHGQHELAMRQTKGSGGMVAFRIKNATLTISNKFLQNLKVFVLAESLGGIESLAELPVVMTHASVAPELRAVLGITDSLIRLSVGIEDSEDLLWDINQALEAAVKA